MYTKPDRFEQCDDFLSPSSLRLSTTVVTLGSAALVEQQYPEGNFFGPLLKKFANISEFSCPSTTLALRTNEIMV